MPGAALTQIAGTALASHRRDRLLHPLLTGVGRSLERGGKIRSFVDYMVAWFERAEKNGQTAECS